MLLCTICSEFAERVMSDQVTKEEVQALRDRIAELEAAREKPVKVEIDGLEGLKQWSHAVETQQLDRFYLQNAVPDNFWLYLAKMVGFLLIGLLVIGVVFRP